MLEILVVAMEQKFVTICLLGITMIAASESLMLAKRLNIDIKKVHEIMKNASGNSWPISVYPTFTRFN